MVVVVAAAAVAVAATVVVAAAATTTTATTACHLRTEWPQPLSHLLDKAVQLYKRDGHIVPV